MTSGCHDKCSYLPRHLATHLSKITLDRHSLPMSRLCSPGESERLFSGTRLVVSCLTSECSHGQERRCDEKTCCLISGSVAAMHSYTAHRLSNHRLFCSHGSPSQVALHRSHSMRQLPSRSWVGWCEGNCRTVIITDTIWLI